MPIPTSTTRWRDEPIFPEDYDVAALIPIARKARRRIVEFDWAFSQDDLVRLSRAVYEWGSKVVGRYKCFDARMLAAINDALGETDTVFVLSEPKNSAGVDCRASCIREGDSFRLRGHAPFDVVFGWGRAGIEQDPETIERLGPTIGETLAEAVGMLGWDLQRLDEKRFQPVRNALYGLRLDYGIEEIEPAAGPATDIAVDFQGPFSAIDEANRRCLFNDEIAEATGVYLWTINVEGKERLWYVGQTRRSFGTRMGEHLADFLSGKYTTYDAAALSRGEYHLAADTVDGTWPQTLPLLLRDYEKLMPSIVALIRLISIHVAQLEGDKHLYDRVEGTLGRHYMAHSDPQLRNFLIPGLRVPATIPFDKPIRLVISSEVPVAGLPQHITA
jgi:hypothetical protein